MAKKKKTGVYAVDGIVANKNLVGFASYLHELEDDEVEFTRFYTHRPLNQEWGQEEVDHDIVSVATTRFEDLGAWHLLSKRGVHIQMPSGDAPIIEAEIADAGTGAEKYGYVSQIRLIGKHLYVCGMSRQVYKFDGKQWRHIDKDILVPDDYPDDAPSTTFDSIDGIAENDIYVAGMNGIIYHYNGKKWTKLKSPTDVHLNRIKCVSTDVVYICGNNGTLLQGNKKDGWQLFQDDKKEDFWGVEYFNELVYLASRKGLRTFDGKDFADVQTGLKQKLDGYRLHANDGVLWSFGQEHLAYFDGTKWTYVKNPDNE